MTDCIFCKIIAKQIPAERVYEDDKVVVFKDIHPKARVHLLVIPTQHIQSLAHTSETEATLLAHMLLTVANIAKEQGLNNGFRTLINTGVAGGQEVDHLHFHLLGGGPAAKT